MQKLSQNYFKKLMMFQQESVLAMNWKFIQANSGRCDYTVQFTRKKRFYSE